MTVCCSVFVCTYGFLGHDWGASSGGVSTRSTNDPGTRARALGSSGLTMIIRSYVVTLCALLFVSCGPTVAQSVAVFDFELIDTSLEGATRGARPDEQQRLARLSDQLRQLVRDSDRFSLVDITPIASTMSVSGGGQDRLKRSLMNSGSHPEAVLGPGAIARCSTTTRRSTSPFR